MVNFYLSTPLMWNHPIEEIFQTAQKYEMGLEIFHQQMEYQRVSIEELQELIYKYRREVFVHAFSWDLNLCSLQRPVRDTALEQTKKSINFAHALGAKDVTIHPGRMSIPLEESNYDSFMYESMKQLMEYADRLEQAISFEIMEPIGKEFVTDRRIMKRIADDLWEKMYLTLDLAHCQNEEMIIDHLEQLPRIRKLHISNHVKGKYHTPIGVGDLDFQVLKPYLTASGLPIVIEGMDQSKELELFLENLNYLEEENWK